MVGECLGESWNDGKEPIEAGYCHLGREESLIDICCLQRGPLATTVHKGESLGLTTHEFDGEGSIAGATIL